MASEIRVNSINNRSGLGTITVADTGIVVSGVVTASTFNVTGTTTVSAGSTSAPSITPTGDSNTGIFFPSDDTIAFTGGGAEAARFDSSGNFQIANGNLVFSTAGTGIDFSATSDGSGTTTSELLDDYEEGTWTPTLIATLVDFSSLTYSTREGRFTKIGRVVYCEFDITITAKSGGNGDINLSGLPYTKPSTQPQYAGDMLTFRGGRSTLLSTSLRIYPVSGTVLGGTDVLEVGYTDSAGTANVYSTSDLNSTGRLVGSFQYIV